MRSLILAAALTLVSAPIMFANRDNRVQLSLDTSEADQVLDIVAARAGGKTIDDAQWQRLFATEPYQRLKVREEAIAKRFNDPSNILKDDEFKAFVLSDALRKQAADLRQTLDQWKQASLADAAEHTLAYLPASATIRCKIYPVIKPNSNSFVWETATNPSIFLFLDPAVSGPKLANTVAHELHHIGLASAQAQYDTRLQALPKRAQIVAQWMEPFGEGLAMLAAAGGPDVDPHAASSPAEQARWDRDLANFDRDLSAVNDFFLDVLSGKLVGDDAISERGSSFFGAQGPWYTVGYKMAVMVEKRFGRDALIATMLDPRQLLVLYNRAATEHNSASTDRFPLWSNDVLDQVRAMSGMAVKR